ncbi:MAG: dTMP kinase [Bacillus subtilis]|nr:dTMP kinase [Bacillus subtilis]
MLDRSHTEMDARTEALLFAASRRQHLKEVILPALEARQDRPLRSITSTVRSSIRASPEALASTPCYEINRFAIEDVLPNLTIFVDVRPEIGLARVFNALGREVNRLDLEQKSFHQTIYDGYKDLIRSLSRPSSNSVAGERPIGVVVEDVLRLIDRRCAKPKATHGRI